MVNMRENPAYAAPSPSHHGSRSSNPLYEPHCPGEPPRSPSAAAGVTLAWPNPHSTSAFAEAPPTPRDGELSGSLIYATASALERASGVFDGGVGDETAAAVSPPPQYMKMALQPLAATEARHRSLVSEF